MSVPSSLCNLHPSSSCTIVSDLRNMLLTRLCPAWCLDKHKIAIVPACASAFSSSRLDSRLASECTGTQCSQTPSRQMFANVNWFTVSYEDCSTKVECIDISNIIVANSLFHVSTLESRFCSLLGRKGISSEDKYSHYRL